MTASDDDCAALVHGLKHTALRNALYHTARRGFLDTANRALNLAVILGGTSYAAAIATGKLATALGFATTAVGALQLVFDFSGRARDHQLLQKRYYDLLSAIESKETPAKQDCVAWSAELQRIYADEPPTLRALDAIADNQATAALIGGDKPRLKVGWLQSLTRHLFPYNGSTFPADPNWK